MKFVGGLVLRVTVVALLASLTTAIVMRISHVRVGLNKIRARLDTLVDDPARVPAFAACDRAPDGWHFRDAWGVTYTHSRRPNRPSHLRRGRPAPIRRTIRRPGRPCAILSAVWTPNTILMSAGQRSMAVSTVIALLASSVMTMVGVAWPLRSRVRRLHDRAMRLGQPDFPTTDVVGADEIADVDRALSGAHRRICSDAAALRRRSEAVEAFLLDFAHDSRTPLTALGMVFEELAVTTNPDEHVTLVRAGLREVVYLRSIADNLRWLVRLDDGEASTAAAPRAIDLEDLVSRAAARARIIARHAGIALNDSLAPCQVQVTVDPTLIEQAVTNVLDNAVLHARGATRIDVTLRPSAAGFRLSIADDGAGFPKRVPLPQPTGARSTRGRARGQGLGLTIIARACAAAGWRCSYQRRAPQGTEVVIEPLP